VTAGRGFDQTRKRQENCRWRWGSKKDGDFQEGEISPSGMKNAFPAWREKENPFTDERDEGMIALRKNQGILLLDGKDVVDYRDGLTAEEVRQSVPSFRGSGETIRKEEAQKGTMAQGILAAHQQGREEEGLKLRFDALASHDITYVGIIQTARAGGLKRFPVPYALTNCHNSLCAVGGTINEDDHLFGLSAAQKYGGIYVPAHQAVIHQYVREQMAGCGKMILGSDSHTRYGALGTMGIGEGGPELVKQLLGRTYDAARPEVVAVLLEGKPESGVGPQDVALSIIRAVFKNGFVQNKVMEFVGPGIENLSVDFRNGIDVMTTETTCLTSIWRTDEKVADFYQTHGRASAYRRLEPGSVAYYAGLIRVDLSRIEPMIALPFHPSHVFSIRELKADLMDILRETEKEGARQLESPGQEYRLTDKVVDGRLKVDQGVIAGCAGGTFENIVYAAHLLQGRSIGDGEFSLSIYPASQPILIELVQRGLLANLLASGATMRTAFCGPCFGAGDVPFNRGLSIRHTTRNFPNREGSRPQDGQIASVALMDARSIAATALNGGVLTAANELPFRSRRLRYHFAAETYENRVYQGYGKPRPEVPLRFGPNIVDWPSMTALPEHLCLRVASVITDPVTTTDELIPSGETSSYRSNPLKLASFTLSRKDPQYVGRAGEAQELEKKRLAFLKEGRADEGLLAAAGPWAAAFAPGISVEAFLRTTGLGSLIFARKPGDGSAREQAASCQKVLGGWVNIANEYATKRYRSNLINWGMAPFTTTEAGEEKLSVGDWVFLADLRQGLRDGSETFEALILKGDGRVIPLALALKNLPPAEREILLAGSLINFYAMTE
jgi:aconitate hydratase